jgi:hypothetical protein
MLELGAGVGRWTVYAAAVISRYRPELRCRLVAVEAEPTHFRWLSQHTRANGLHCWSHAGSCRLVEEAVSGASGREPFYVGAIPGADMGRRSSGLRTLASRQRSGWCGR